MKWLLWLWLSLVGLAPGVNADEVTWLGSDYPPMAMSQGEYANQGYINALYGFLQTALPQHRFEEAILPWARVMHMAQGGGPYCLISAFRTPERSQFLRFSEPYGYLLPIGVVIRAQDQARFAPYINAEGLIRLAQVLDDLSISLGVASDRSYGPRIDDVLRTPLQRGAANIKKIYQGESSKSLFDMLGYKRIDYVFSYPSEVVYYAKGDRTLLFYPIEGNSQLLEGRLSCTKSPMTDQVFADITAKVPSNASAAVFQAAYERWLPRYLIEPYRQQLQRLAQPQP